MSEPLLYPSNGYNKWRNDGPTYVLCRESRQICSPCCGWTPYDSRRSPQYGRPAGGQGPTLLSSQLVIYWTVLFRLSNYPLSDILSCVRVIIIIHRQIIFKSSSHRFRCKSAVFVFILFGLIPTASLLANVKSNC